MGVWSKFCISTVDVSFQYFRLSEKRVKWMFKLGKLN